MFLGINMYWALLRAHFNPNLKALAEESLSRGPKHIYNRQHNLFYCKGTLHMYML